MDCDNVVFSNDAPTFPTGAPIISYTQRNSGQQAIPTQVSRRGEEIHDKIRNTQVHSLSAVSLEVFAACTSYANYFVRFAISEFRQLESAAEEVGLFLQRDPPFGRQGVCRHPRGADGTASDGQLTGRLSQPHFRHLRTARADQLAHSPLIRQQDQGHRGGHLEGLRKAAGN